MPSCVRNAHHTPENEEKPARRRAFRDIVQYSNFGFINTGYTLCSKTPRLRLKQSSVHLRFCRASLRTRLSLCRARSRSCILHFSRAFRFYTQQVRCRSHRPLWRARTHRAPSSRHTPHQRHFDNILRRLVFVGIELMVTRKDRHDFFAGDRRVWLECAVGISHDDPARRSPFYGLGVPFS